MTENMKKFSEAASSNADLQKDLAALDKKVQDEIVTETIAIAKKHGIELVEADFAPDEEISVEDLDAVAGGASFCIFTGDNGKGWCIFTGR